jgi:hypothetical protein
MLLSTSKCAHCQAFQMSALSKSTLHVIIEASPNFQLNTPAFALWVENLIRLVNHTGICSNIRACGDENSCSESKLTYSPLQVFAVRAYREQQIAALCFNFNELCPCNLSCN